MLPFLVIAARGTQSTSTFMLVKNNCGKEIPSRLTKCFYFYCHIIKQSIIFLYYYYYFMNWKIHRLWNFRTALKWMVSVPDLYFNMLPAIAAHNNIIERGGWISFTQLFLWVISRYEVSHTTPRCPNNEIVLMDKQAPHGL